MTELVEFIAIDLLANITQRTIQYELQNDGLSVESEVALPVVYDKLKIDAGYRIDRIVEGIVIIENKTVDKLLPIHEAQL